MFCTTTAAPAAGTMTATTTVSNQPSDQQSPSCLKQFNVHRRGLPKMESSEALARRRSRSNRKERRRNEEMNVAYARLQRCVPHIPNDQKLPKIKTLRLALRYIQHLQNVLDGDQFRGSFSNEVRPLQLEDFASVAMAEVQARNNYKDRAAREAQMGIRTEDICRKNSENKTPRQDSIPANLQAEAYYPVIYTSTESSSLSCSPENVLPPLFFQSPKSDDDVKYEQLSYMQY